MRKILLRFDDICPTMNWDNWNQAVCIMDKYNIKPLIGVVPDCKDPELCITTPCAEFWDYIKKLEKNGYKVAMHGFQHLYDSNVRGIVNVKKVSEFAGHSYEEQYEKIYNGYTCFLNHNLNVDTFFAPSHSYDIDTIHALAACGFKYMSDGKTNKPVSIDGVICVPCINGGVPKHIRQGYYIAVFHAHQWNNEKITQFEAFCNKYKNDIVTFNDFLYGRKCGNRMFQSGIQFMRVTRDRYLTPVLVKIKHKMMRK